MDIPFLFNMYLEDILVKKIWCDMLGGMAPASPLAPLLCICLVTWIVHAKPLIVHFKVVFSCLD